MVFVIRCLYSAVSLTLVREQRFLRIIYLFIIIIITYVIYIAKVRCVHSYNYRYLIYLRLFITTCIGCVLFVNAHVWMDRHQDIPVHMFVSLAKRYPRIRVCQGLVFGNLAGWGEEFQNHYSFSLSVYLWYAVYEWVWRRMSV